MCIDCHGRNSESMVHYFRADRPGQSRGIPDITPALPLFAQLLLRAWLREAVLIEGLLPQWMRQRGALDNLPLFRGWFWDGLEHVDPAKEANAQKTRLDSHTTTLAREHARQGRDWEIELRQRAKEKALMDELGLAPGSDKSAANEHNRQPTGVADDDD